MVVLVLAHVAIFLLKHGTARNFDMMQLRRNLPRPLVILEFEITLQVVIGEYFSVEKGKTCLPTHIIKSKCNIIIIFSLHKVLP